MKKMRRNLILVSRNSKPTKSKFEIYEKNTIVKLDEFFFLLHEQ